MTDKTRMMNGDPRPVIAVVPAAGSKAKVVTEGFDAVAHGFRIGDIVTATGETVPGENADDPNLVRFRRADGLKQWLEPADYELIP